MSTPAREARAATVSDYIFKVLNCVYTRCKGRFKMVLAYQCLNMTYCLILDKAER